MNTLKEDRLYQMLPTVYRLRDAEQGEPLKALLQVIAEQVNLVEDDINQLYENWFIETCEDWVVPYIGDLIGYEPVHEAGQPSAVDTTAGQQRNKILIPRTEVANTIRYRRKKGTLALLELLANDVAGYPARAVEFYRRLAYTQALNHRRMQRAQTVNLRQDSVLALLDGPFDKLSHTANIRRINSLREPGYHNIPSVGLFVWRIKSYPVTHSPAYCQEGAGPHCFTFSILGNDAPLYLRPQPEEDPTQIADELNLPVPIRRQLLEDQKKQLYGAGKSIQIWTGVGKGKNIKPQPVPLEKIVPADLSDWKYLPRKGTVAVDPELGRIAFPTRQAPKNGVWVSYHYGFSMNLGGGEYDRQLTQPREYTLYRVGKGKAFETINAALDQWRTDNPCHAVIEIADSGVYVEQIVVDFSGSDTPVAQRESLQIRAANYRRPVIRLLDWKTDRPDSFLVIGANKERFALDGVLVTGRGMQVSGDLCELNICHSTLVPGWELDADCVPKRAAEPSLEVFSPDVCVHIEHSILGTIQIDPSMEISLADSPEKEPPNYSEAEALMARCRGISGEARLDPIRVCISDSVVDAVEPEAEAIGAPGCPVAHACLNIVRSTVFGQIQVHAIELGENTLFNGRIIVARRQKGCLRFSYIAPESRTPQRYRCQPDLVIADLQKRFEGGEISKAERDRLSDIEGLRVKPQFNSMYYGQPAYCQLADTCAREIREGADDEAEMGVFHNLFQPQRAANLRVRIDEYLPAKMDAGIIFSS